METQRPITVRNPRRGLRRRRRRIRRLLTGLAIAAGLLAVFGSVGVVHVMERRPVPYETPESYRGASLPVRAGQAAPRLGRGDGDVRIDEDAVRGIADAYRWDERVMRELSHTRAERLTFDDPGAPLVLDGLVPGSFLDGCSDGEPVHEEADEEEAVDGLPPVSAPPPVPEPAQLVAAPLALAGLAGVAARL